MQPPEGPPICTALILPAVLDAAGDVEDDVSQRQLPMGTSTRPPRWTLPVRAKTLVPLEFSVPMAAKVGAAVLDDPGHVGKGLYVVNVGGLIQNSRFWAGKGGLSRGMPRLPSMDSMRAVSSPQTKAPAPTLMFRSQEKPVPRMFLPNRPRAAGLLDGLAQPLHRQGVLRPDIHDTCRWPRWHRRQ